MLRRLMPRLYSIASSPKVFPDEVHYLKSEETIVITKPTENWKSLFYQRVRWAAKTSSYQSSFGKFLGLVVFFGNLSFVIGFVFFLFGSRTLCVLATQMRTGCRNWMTRHSFALPKIPRGRSEQARAEILVVYESVMIFPAAPIVWPGSLLLSCFFFW